MSDGLQNIFCRKLPDIPKKINNGPEKFEEKLEVPEGLLLSANAKINIKNSLIFKNFKEDLQSLVNTNIPLYSQNVTT